MREEKKIKKIVEKVAVKMATAEANSACSCISYQPKMPKAVKRLRKF